MLEFLERVGVKNVSTKAAVVAGACIGGAAVGLYVMPRICRLLVKRQPDLFVDGEVIQPNVSVCVCDLRIDALLVVRYRRGVLPLYALPCDRRVSDRY